MHAQHALEMLTAREAAHHTHMKFWCTLIFPPNSPHSWPEGKYTFFSFLTAHTELAHLHCSAESGAEIAKVPQKSQITGGRQVQGLQRSRTAQLAQPLKNTRV